MLKCYECEKELAATARVCPSCGSKQQFKGYVFSREEVKAMGVNKVSDFYNFENCGGKIKVVNWNKVFKISAVVLGLYLFIKLSA